MKLLFTFLCPHCNLHNIFMIGYYVTGTESYDIVWTMPHCILVLRLSGLAFDLYDGSLPEVINIYN